MPEVVLAAEVVVMPERRLSLGMVSAPSWSIEAYLCFCWPIRVSASTPLMFPRIMPMVLLLKVKPSTPLSPDKLAGRVCDVPVRLGECLLLCNSCRLLLTVSALPLVEKYGVYEGSQRSMLFGKPCFETPLPPTHPSFVVLGFFRGTLLPLLEGMLPFLDAPLPKVGFALSMSATAARRSNIPY